MDVINNRLNLNEIGYSQMTVVETVDPNVRPESAFFGSTSDFEHSLTCANFRFSLPGQYLTDDYRRHIRGFFVNEPCPYNHRIFKYSATLFGIMRHPPEAFMSPATRAAAAALAAKKAGVIATSPKRSAAGGGNGATTERRNSKQLSSASSSVQGGNRPQAAPSKTNTLATTPRSVRRSSVGVGKTGTNDLDLPELEFASENEKRLTYQLVFQTLKYQRFLEDMLADSKFLLQYPEFEDDLSSIMVLLCDLKLRKFQRRLPTSEESVDTKLLRMEDALFRSKIRLNAALARSRIKSQVLSIDWLLPDRVRKNEMIGSRMLVTCWVNYLKCSMFYVKNDLLRDGFKEVTSEDQLEGKTFMLDQEFDDVILFPNELMTMLENHFMVAQGMLVMQDKSSSVGPHCIKHLMGDDDDVLHVNAGSALTSAHLASLTHRSSSIIYAAGIYSDRQLRTILKNLDRLGARSRVKVILGNFINIPPNDERLRDIKLVLVTALCSKSGIANPVSFVVTEGEDLSLLRDLSLGQTDISKVGELVVQHQAVLKQAMRLPRVQGVIYSTRSLIDIENDNVVNSSVELVTTTQQSKMPFRVSPPVLPLSEEAIVSESPLAGKFLKYMPTSSMSGCFVATITREAEDPKEAAKGILARAAARGIINGVHHDIPDLISKDKKRAKKKNQKPKKESLDKDSDKPVKNAKKNKKISPVNTSNEPTRSSTELTTNTHSTAQLDTNPLPDIAVTETS